MSEPDVLRGPVRHYAKGDDASIEPRWWVECPICGLEAMIDGEQYRGEVSINCPNCPYHETHDLRRTDEEE